MFLLQGHVTAPLARINSQLTGVRFIARERANAHYRRYRASYDALSIFIIYPPTGPVIVDGIGSGYFALEWSLARVISLVAMTRRARSVFLIIPNISVINVAAISRERDILYYINRKAR